MPLQNQPIVRTATWIARPSYRVALRDDLLVLPRREFEELLGDLNHGNDLTARAGSGFEQLVPEAYEAARGADVTGAADGADERFPHEKACQDIVLTLVTKYCGYNYPRTDPHVITRIRNITALHDKRERRTPGLHRDTVVDILEEADPRTGRGRGRKNREKSYYKLIDALVHEFCGDGEGGVSPKAPEKIAQLVRDQGGSIEVEVVREILEAAKRAVESEL